MTIQKTYQTYQIPPTLQMHQYRVAAVAQIIAKSMTTVQVDTENIVRACLLHDMGNIIKFNMDLFPEFFEPEGIDYWNEVKQSFIKKYGPDEHVATIMIAREIFSSELEMRNEKLERNTRHSRADGNPMDLLGDPRLRGDDNNTFDPTRILDLIDAIGFSNAKRNYQSDDFGWKIAAYADMRVEPHGVTTLKKRLEDGHKRFNLNKPGQRREVFFWKMAGYLEKIEDQIFEKSTLRPVEITEDSVSFMYPVLQNIII